jgi:uncharacterized protein (TIGR02611 family)
VTSFRRDTPVVFSGVDRARQLLGVIVRSTRRLAVLVVGAAVTVAGLVMLVTPGPGLVVIIAGLAILATEFTWAEILLERAKRQALRAKDAAVRQAGLLRRRRTITVELTEVTEVFELPTTEDGSATAAAGEADPAEAPPPRPLHGPPVPLGHVELLAISIVDRTETVDAND